MKIYTKTGDSGVTSLLGGKRVDKDCREMMAIGEVDELNAALGVVVSVVPDEFAIMRQRLILVQHVLFNLGANLAAAQTALVNVPPVTELQVVYLEAWIDEMSVDLPPLAQFILPGGHSAAAQSFYARAVCRRAEREIVTLGRIYKFDEILIRYLNRLSDALFVFGRWLNWKSNREETIWQKTR